MTEVLQAHQILLVNVCQEKRTDHLVQISRKEVVKGQIHVIIGMFPDVKNFVAPVDAHSETSVHTHTAKSADEKTNSASSAIHIHRMMDDRCKYETFRRMKRPNTEWDSIISGTSTFPKGKTGTFPWSHPDQISKSAKSKRYNIRRKIFRMDFEHSRIIKESSLDLTQEHVQSFRFILWESNSSSQIPRASPSKTTSRDTEFSVDWEASLRMTRKSDLVQKNRKRFKRRRIHQLPWLQMEQVMRLKKQQHVSVIWTCLFMSNDWQNHPRCSRWVNCARKTVIRMNGIQVSHHIS